MKARQRLAKAMPGLKERAKTLLELVQAADFLFIDGARTLDAAAEKVMNQESRAILAKIVGSLERTEWTGPALEAAARSFADSEGLKLGQVAQPLRAALTGKVTSPPLFEMMSVLGREESLIRLWAYAA
jgi:glutamyl-tRNA synthetase